MDEINDTSGFYKKENGELLHGTVVLNSSYELRSETKGQHTYPIDGWSWFDSKEDAESNLPEPNNV